MVDQTGYHFTLVSNIRCRRGECRIFETLPAYRKKGNLLTVERRQILKALTGCVDRPLKVKAVNVAQQGEVECGSLCIALCSQFLFHDNVFVSFYDTRKTLHSILTNNALEDVKHYPRVVKDHYLFEETI